MSARNDLRTQITATIIDAVENKNLLPWRRPWTGAAGRHRSAATGRAYRGMNPLLLEVHAVNHGFRSRSWGTYNQWSALGLQVGKRPAAVKPGRWGATVLLYRPVTSTKADADTGERVEDSFLVMRQFTVFNADQVSGPGVEKYRAPAATTAATDPDFAPAEALIRASGAAVTHRGDRAYYQRPTPDGSWPHHAAGDEIVLPPRHAFRSTGAYYETCFHELGHWAEVRLGWDHRLHGYAMGELVAEMSASYLSADLGVPQGEPLDSHAAYLKHWLDGMKGDSSFIFKASSQAGRVADYLLGFVRPPAEVGAGELVEAA